MRAIQIVELGGPESLQLADIDEPTGDGVTVDVRAAGVSFPEVLQTRGLYQIKPELPFVPGSEVAGVVRADAHGFKAGDRNGHHLQNRSGADCAMIGATS